MNVAVMSLEMEVRREVFWVVSSVRRGVRRRVQEPGFSFRVVDFGRGILFLFQLEKGSSSG